MFLCHHAPANKLSCPLFPLSPSHSVVFAMEYLPGGDLYQRLSDKGTLSLGEAVAWTAQAVLAIEDLHAKNIVHRDVKPGAWYFVCMSRLQRACLLIALFLR